MDTVWNLDLRGHPPVVLPSPVERDELPPMGGRGATVGRWLVLTGDCVLGVSGTTRFYFDGQVAGRPGPYRDRRIVSDQLEKRELAGFVFLSGLLGVSQRR